MHLKRFPALFTLGAATIACGQTAELIYLGDVEPTAVSGDGSTVFGRGPFSGPPDFIAGQWVWRGEGPPEQLMFHGRRFDENFMRITGASFDGEMVVGYRHEGDEPGGFAPFTLCNGQLEFLPVPETRRDAVANGCDSTGRLICGAALEGPINPPLVDQPTNYVRQLPVLWRDGVFESPEAGPDGWGGSAWGVSDDGRVLVGISGPYLPNGDLRLLHATMWIDGRRTIIQPPADLLPPGYNEGVLIDVSTCGEVAVGGFWEAGQGWRDRWAPFALVRGSIQFLPVGSFALPFSERKVNAVSGDGDVIVGLDWTQSGHEKYRAALLWRIDRGFPESFPVSRLVVAHNIGAPSDLFIELQTVNTNGTVMTGDGDYQFVLKLPPRCLADISGSPSDPDVWDGRTNLTDLLRFIDLYSSNDPRADIAGNTQPGDPRDGVVDTTDLDTYLDRWQRGVGQCLDYP